MTKRLPLAMALDMAESRRGKREAAIYADLTELFEAGCCIRVSAEQLLLLESEGFLYDFETGYCEQAPEATSTSPSDQPIRNRIIDEINRRRENWRQIGATLPTTDHIAQTAMEARLSTYLECMQIFLLPATTLRNGG